MLLRHEAKFSADWVTSGILSTSFDWVVLRRSDVIKRTADNEDACQGQIQTA